MRAAVFTANAAFGALPFTVTIRIGVPRRLDPAGMISNGPTPNAIRYVGSGFVVANTTR